MKNYKNKKKDYTTKRMKERAINERAKKNAWKNH